MSDFPKALSAPARRALTGAGISTLERLAMYSEAEILKLHGVGPASLPPLQQALASAGLAFAAPGAARQA
jgi:DNA-directed RNA polymerase alpha subunit